jgi:DNA repair protein RadC
VNALKKADFTGFHDYEVLEFLLSLLFSGKGDVKPLAKELIKTFGSFSKVLDASVAELENSKRHGQSFCFKPSCF